MLTAESLSSFSSSETHRISINRAPQGPSCCRPLTSCWSRTTSTIVNSPSAHSVNMVLYNKVRVCTDGQQATRFVLKQGEYSDRSKVGLVLLDLNLPTLSGLDVLAMIRANRETRKVAVIVLTSSHDMPDIEEARKRGADHYMVKPIDFANMIQVAKTLGLGWALLGRESHAATA